jgi:pyruvate kinase
MLLFHLSVMRVKLIASLGPSTRNYDQIRMLLMEGISGFRINLAHGDLAFWKSLVSSVRGAESDIKRPAAVIVDVRGPSIRLGNFSKVISVKAGDKVTFSLDEFSSEDKIVPLPNEEVVEKVREGDIFMMDDGRMRFKIISRGKKSFLAESLTDGILKPEKAVSFPERKFNMPILTEDDVSGLESLCDEVDYVGISLVRKGEDILYVRNIINKLNQDISLISKIENKSAVENLNSIIGLSDAVLVARGDLGMNFGLEEIPILQRRIVRETLRMGKPVIVATQLLESMMSSPVPTRAEVVDIANAVEEGVDALMLTGETAAGSYPLEAVKWLKKVAERAESFYSINVNRMGESVKRRYAKGVVELAEDLGGKLLVYSMKGTTAAIISSLRPKARTYVGVPSVKVARKLAIMWGLDARVIPADNYYDGLDKLYTALLNGGELAEGELVVLTYGLRDYEQVIRVKKVSTANSL